MDADRPKIGEGSYGLGRHMVYAAVADVGFLCASVGWMLFGFAIFTAKDGYGWYYPVGGVLALGFVSSCIWLIGAGLAWLMDKWQRD